MGSGIIYNCLAWESLALLQGSFGPFGPKVANRVRKWVPRPSRPRGPKSAKRSRKRVKIDYFSTILTLFRLRFGLFGPRGRKGLGTHLQLSARRAQRTLVVGKRFRNAWPPSILIFQALSVVGVLLELEIAFLNWPEDHFR